MGRISVPDRVNIMVDSIRLSIPVRTNTEDRINVDLAVKYVLYIQFRSVKQVFYLLGRTGT